MAQRTHTCPLCSALVEVPDQQLLASSTCPACGAILDCRSGAPFEAPAEIAEPAPAQSQPAPQLHSAPQYATPPQYAAQHPGIYPGNYPPHAYVVPPKNSVPHWAAVLLICGVVFIGGVVALGMWVTGKASEAVTTPPPPDLPPADWVEYRSPDGWFTAKFPRQPRVSGKDAGHGIFVTSAISSMGEDFWEISWAEFNQRQSFDFDVAMEGAADDLDGKLTKKEAADFKGMRGMYGEIDNGRYKVQIFRSPMRVWGVIVGEYRDDFDFFLKNLRLLDAAMNIRPLQIVFQPGVDLYEGLLPPEGVLKFQPHGGRKPYEFTVTGDMPPGLRSTTRDDLNGAMLMEGTPTKSGTYAVQVSVEDADGRVATARATHVVKALSDVQITVSPRLRLWQRLGPLERVAEMEDTWRHECMVGGPISILFVAESDLPGYVANVTDVDASESELPPWITVSKGQQIVIAGTPEVPELVELTMQVKGKLDNLEREFSWPVKLHIDVKPLAPWACPPRDGTGLLESRLTCAVGIPTKGVLARIPAKPKGWNSSRKWQLDVKWTLRADELPPGMTFEEVPQDWRDPAGLGVRGTPEAVGTWDVTVICVATIQYIDEPYETTHKWTIEVTPVPESERPLKLSPPRELWTLTGRPGGRFGHVLPFRCTARGRWNSQRDWEVSGHWNLDDVSLPEGLYFEEFDPADGTFPSVILRGSTEQSGEWEFELRAVVTVKYVDEPYDVIQRVKLTIN